MFILEQFRNTVCGSLSQVISTLFGFKYSLIAPQSSNLLLKSDKACIWITSSLKYLLYSEKYLKYLSQHMQIVTGGKLLLCIAFF
jgi:hypothetical protein